MATNLTGVPDPGLGNLLQQQTQMETEEERRKRLLGLQQRAELAPVSSVLGGGGFGPVAKAMSGGLLGRR